MISARAAMDGDVFKAGINARYNSQNRSAGADPCRAKGLQSSRQVRDQTGSMEPRMG